MKCDICKQQNVETNARGTCARCLMGACAAPPDRPDGEYHGESCKCRCEKFFCEPHTSSHARDDEGSDPDKCFPGLHGSTAVLAFSVTAGALGSGRTGERIAARTAATINRYLNVVAPGHRALLSAVGKLDEDLVELDSKHWARADETFVRFQPRFLTEGSLERILALSARTMGRTARALTQSVTERPGLDARRLTTLSKFDRWAISPDPERAPDPEMLEPWVPMDVPDRAGTARRLAAVLATTKLPSGAAAVVDWLVEDFRFDVMSAGA